MQIVYVYICVLLVLHPELCEVRNVDCPELPDRALKAILGTTYNARYMSFDLPIIIDANPGHGGPKRASFHDHAEFFMDDEEDNPYAGIPAWEVDHVEILKERRKIRAVEPEKRTKKRNARQAFLDNISTTPKKDVFQSRPWDCKAEIHWIDLGHDYFPRYLRSVKCMKKTCWYGHYTCKPKKFSIKVLRRSNGQCAKVSQRLKIFSFVSGDLAQQWEFEEKAVTFCCDCVMNY